MFALTFNEAFDDALLREVAPRRTAAPAAAPAQPTRWDALSLVDDREMEIQVSADRFALEIAHGCEWELRELDALHGRPARPARDGHSTATRCGPRSSARR